MDHMSELTEAVSSTSENEESNEAMSDMEADPAHPTQAIAALSPPCPRLGSPARAAASTITSLRAQIHTLLIKAVALSSAHQATVTAYFAAPWVDIALPPPAGVQ